jgi:hypothetical protein
MLSIGFYKVVMFSLGFILVNLNRFTILILRLSGKKHSSRNKNSETFDYRVLPSLYNQSEVEGFGINYFGMMVK